VLSAGLFEEFEEFEEFEGFQGFHVVSSCFRVIARRYDVATEVSGF